jgi:hypothetical protein
MKKVPQSCFHGAILWMGQRNPTHQLIDGKHPIVGVNHPKLVVQDFAGPSTV